MPEVIDGLGTVQAFNLVSIKPLVSGQIVHIYFRQGEAVSTGQKLFEIDPRPYRAALDQAIATQLKDQATLLGAESDLARYAPLLRQNYTSKKIYEDQLATVNELKATVQFDKALIEAARLNLTYTLIRAPISGRTGAILVNVGNVVQASQSPVLVTLAQTIPVYVSFAVPQDILTRLRARREMHRLPVAAVSASDHSILSHGHLAFINNQIDTATDTVTVMGEFSNRDEALWPGEFVDAQVTLSVQRHAITVPQPALVEGPDGPYVYLINWDNTVKRQPVTLLREYKGLAVIGKGLSAGQRIVEDGQFRLTNGARVSIEPKRPPGRAAQTSAS